GGCVLVENKAVQALAASHGAQLVNYLVATKIETGLLFNFGCESLQFKRKFRTCRHRQSSHVTKDVSPSPLQSIIPPALRQVRQLNPEILPILKSCQCVPGDADQSPHLPEPRRQWRGTWRDSL